MGWVTCRHAVRRFALGSYFTAVPLSHEKIPRRKYTTVAIVMVQGVFGCVIVYILSGFTTGMGNWRSL